METAALITQILIALVILNVWLLRFGNATGYRGGDAQNMTEEFAVYGLPRWSVRVIGFFKITFSALLIAGVWVPALTLPAAIGMGVLMLGAVTMHIKVQDPPKKGMPAFTLMLLCGFVALVAGGLI